MPKKPDQPANTSSSNGDDSDTVQRKRNNDDDASGQQKSDTDGDVALPSYKGRNQEKQTKEVGRLAKTGTMASRYDADGRGAFVSTRIDLDDCEKLEEGDPPPPDHHLQDPIESDMIRNKDDSVQEKGPPRGTDDGILTHRDQVRKGRVHRPSSNDDEDESSQPSVGEDDVMLPTFKDQVRDLPVAQRHQHQQQQQRQNQQKPAADPLLSPPQGVLPSYKDQAREVEPHQLQPHQQQKQAADPLLTPPHGVLPSYKDQAREADPPLQQQQQQAKPAANNFLFPPQGMLATNKDQAREVDPPVGQQQQQQQQQQPDASFVPIAQGVPLSGDHDPEEMLVDADGIIVQRRVTTANDGAPPISQQFSEINNSGNNNTYSSVAPTPALPLQQGGIKKHMIWAAVVVSIALVITVALVVSDSIGASSTFEPPMGPPEGPALVPVSAPPTAVSPSAAPSMAAPFVGVEPSDMAKNAVKLKASDSDEEDRFGKSVAIDGDTLVVGAFWDNDKCNRCGSVYVFTRSGWRWTETEKLTTSDGTQSYRPGFGLHVAISGNTLVVGAPFDDDNNATDSGSVYIFTQTFSGSTATWTEQAKLTASDGLPGDQFGSHVAINKDTVVVGADKSDSGNSTDSGSVYVFTPSSGSSSIWTEQAKLTASDGAVNDNFGTSLAIEGDTLVIGAYEDDDNGFYSGSAYIFTYSPGTSAWTEQAKLTASDGERFDRFGISLAISRDTVVIGSNGSDGNDFSSGGAYVFTPSSFGSTEWTEQAKLTASDGAQFDQFGLRVAISGDTVVIGSYESDDNGSDSGSVYIFIRHFGSTMWTEQAKLRASDAAAEDNFGISVAVSGDTVVVGADGDDDKANRSGSAYVFDFEPSFAIAGKLREVAKLVPSDLAARDRFGSSVAVDGDVVFVGSMWDDEKGTGTGSVYIFAHSPEFLAWTEQAKLIASDGGADSNFGVAVAISGNTLVVGADRDDNEYGDNRGSVYIFTYSSGLTTMWTEQAKLIAIDGDPEERFGYSVAIDGDTVVVGAFLDDQIGVDSGSIYIFKRSSGLTAWTEEAKLVARNGAAFDAFGSDVAIDKDTIVVGAYGHDLNGEDRGSAYVFIRSNGSTPWTEQAKLVASDGNAGDQFGIVVTIGGDIIVVGSNGDNSGSGSAYIFTRWAGSTSWTEQVKLLPSNATTGDRFGWDVAVDGEIVVVGAYEDDGNDADSGSVYIFSPSSGNSKVWTEQAKLVASDGATGDWFGRNIAMRRGTVVVGAFKNDSNGTDSGAAYIFDVQQQTSAVEPSNVAKNAAKLKARGGGAVDWFGEKVAISGDTVVVGAFHDDDKATNSGSAYIFSQSGLTWTEKIKLTASDGDENDGFGGSLAISADTLAIGAFLDDNGNDENSGSVYIFKNSSGSTSTWTEQAKLTASDKAPEDYFGASVAIDGDLLVVGAVLDNDNGADSGSVYIFSRSSESWTEQAKLVASDGDAGDWFGINVAVSGDTVVVGAFQDDDNAANGGSVYIFTRSLESTVTWTEEVKLTPNDSSTGDQFGFSLAIDGDTLLVGSNRESFGRGSAYIFTRSSGSSPWTEQAKLIASDGSRSDNFGFAVAINGDTILVGSPGSDGSSTGSGSVYIFSRPSGSTTWTEQAKVFASGGAAGDGFGNSVSIEGDTVVIGTPYDDDKGDDSGSAYVFNLL